VAKRYSGAYIKGSDAGRGNNLRGAEAEAFLEKVFEELGYHLGTSYFRQIRVPYLSPERYRKISAAYSLSKRTFRESFKEKQISFKDPMDYFWESGGPNIQEDFALGSSSCDHNGIHTIISVTQANPDKPGHSIENKLHQALGELYLHKIYNPKCRSILFIGGEGAGWASKAQFKNHGCSYVLRTFELFFDDVVYAWDNNPRKRIKQALECNLRNINFWKDEKIRAESINLDTDRTNIPNKNLREEFISNVLFPLAERRIHAITQITNPVARFMIECSLKSNRHFFDKVINNDRVGIETDRGFNNAPEAAICLLLNKAGLKYSSEMENAKAAVKVSENLLYHLGYKNMHRHTDFILKGKDGLPVYIESKSAGGGFEGGHKHITDRAREQIARSLLHRTTLKDGEIQSNPQHYHWIFILDADWHTPDLYPHKFVHILQLAGAERWFSARELLDDNYTINNNCAFLNYIKKLCI